jgi:hypothetical protein
VWAGAQLAGCCPAEQVVDDLAGSLVARGEGEPVGRGDGAEAGADLLGGGVDLVEHGGKSGARVVAGAGLALIVSLVCHLVHLAGSPGAYMCSA